MRRMFLNGTAMSGQKDHGAMAGAMFIGPARTAARYRFFAVRDEFPGLYPVDVDGRSIEGELYEMTEAILFDTLLPAGAGRAGDRHDRARRRADRQRHAAAAGAHSSAATRWSTSPSSAACGATRRTSRRTSTRAASSASPKPSCRQLRRRARRLAGPRGGEHGRAADRRRRLLAASPSWPPSGGRRTGGVTRLASRPRTSPRREPGRQVDARRRAGRVRSTQPCNLVGRAPHLWADGSLLGSHIDTVRDAGALDGCYGVLAAIEVVERASRGRGVSVIAFANEEGAVGDGAVHRQPDHRRRPARGHPVPRRRARRRRRRRVAAGRRRRGRPRRSGPTSSCTSSRVRCWLPVGSASAPSRRSPGSATLEVRIDRRRQPCRHDADARCAAMRSPQRPHRARRGGDGQRRHGPRRHGRPPGGQPGRRATSCRRGRAVGRRARHRRRPHRRRRSPRLRSADRGGGRGPAPTTSSTQLAATAPVHSDPRAGRQIVAAAADLAMAPCACRPAPDTTRRSSAWSRRWR